MKEEKTMSEINTGLTAVELKGNIVNQLKPMNAQEQSFSIVAIDAYLERKGNPEYVMLLSNELRYYTIFKSSTDADFATEIFNFINTDSYLTQLGYLRLIDADKDLDHVEVWIGDKFFALFDADDLIVDL